VVYSSEKSRLFLKVMAVSMSLSGMAEGAAFAKTLRSLALSIDPEIQIGESVWTEKDVEIKAQARTTKVENVLEYDLMGIVREAGNYRVEIVPLNGVNSMIRGEKVTSGEVWMTPKN